MDSMERQGSEARRPPCDVGAFLAESGGALGAGDFRQVPYPEFCERRAASIGGDAPLAGFGFEDLKCGFGGRHCGHAFQTAEGVPGASGMVSGRKPGIEDLSSLPETANARLASIEDLFVTCCAGLARSDLGLGTASFRCLSLSASATDTVTATRWVKAKRCKWLQGNVKKTSGMWRNGRRRGLKIPRPQGRAGSSPAIPTTFYGCFDGSLTVRDSLGTSKLRDIGR